MWLKTENKQKITLPASYWLTLQQFKAKVKPVNYKKAIDCAMDCDTACKGSEIAWIAFLCQFEIYFLVCSRNNNVKTLRNEERNDRQMSLQHGQKAKSNCYQCGKRTSIISSPSKSSFAGVPSGDKTSPSNMNFTCASIEAIQPCKSGDSLIAEKYKWRSTVKIARFTASTTVYPFASLLRFCFKACCFTLESFQLCQTIHCQARWLMHKGINLLMSKFFIHFKHFPESICSPHFQYFDSLFRLQPKERLKVSSKSVHHHYL